MWTDIFGLNPEKPVKYRLVLSTLNGEYGIMVALQFSKLKVSVRFRLLAQHIRRIGRYRFAALHC